MDPMKAIKQKGQSFWLDFIKRDWLIDGQLKEKIEAGICGLTSNPSIFLDALEKSNQYDEQIANYKKNTPTPQRHPKDLLDQLCITDIQMAADLLHPLYLQTQTKDGYASLEIAPDLAFNHFATVEEIKKFWKILNRPNVMLKLPATKESIHAFADLIAEGININVTLLFSYKTYEEVANAYIDALSYRAKKNLNIGKIASVASFFISRIDTLVDNWLQEHAPNSSLLGHIAIANAQKAFKISQKLFESSKWLTLQEKGAHRQRLLWASTSTKNPDYASLKYVEELIAPHTVNTLPPTTFENFLKNGKCIEKFENTITYAEKTLQKLNETGFQYDESMHHLLHQGIDLFDNSYQKLLNSLANRLNI